MTDIDIDAWEFILNVNLRGIFLCAKYGVPALIDAGGGSVINTASVAGLIGSPNSGHAYAASKGGAIALTRAMAASYAKYQVRVNAICPGTLETPMTADTCFRSSDRHREIVAQHPLGRLGVASDIVHLAVYLAADESAWVTGGVFTVDGGRTAT